MRRIDEVKSKKIKYPKSVEFLSKKRIKITFRNGQSIVLLARPEEWGYEGGIYIEKEHNDEDY